MLRVHCISLVLALLTAGSSLAQPVHHQKTPNEPQLVHPSNSAPSSELSDPRLPLPCPGNDDQNPGRLNLGNLEPSQLKDKRIQARAFECFRDNAMNLVPLFYWAVSQDNHEPLLEKVTEAILASDDFGNVFGRLMGPQNGQMWINQQLRTKTTHTVPFKKSHIGRFLRFHPLEFAVSRGLEDPVLRIWSHAMQHQLIPQLSIPHMAGPVRAYFEAAYRSLFKVAVVYDLGTFAHTLSQSLAYGQAPFPQGGGVLGSQAPFHTVMNLWAVQGNRAKVVEQLASPEFCRYYIVGTLMDSMARAGWAFTHRVFGKVLELNGYYNIPTYSAVVAAATSDHVRLDTEKLFLPASYQAPENPDSEEGHTSIVNFLEITEVVASHS
ncbi:hypothetical protein BJ085DRAFT_30673 [Dimargaris cristalligena]|uniref:Uncharacterized protein n=1 Tax=Dimargaris cristalligena TaxID=215637 RepID=A0A4Q0A330_9FUNG|nr:hypothetical protein BJ085DRAFT_30673 [Dimargaris cristalligena]|eukprot:RKP39620.1 hypothetical protein BJ085DRAFT_30673 [Dimargaris cristalligena]